MIAFVNFEAYYGSFVFVFLDSETAKLSDIKPSNEAISNNRSVLPAFTAFYDKIQQKIDNSKGKSIEQPEVCSSTKPSQSFFIFYFLKLTFLPLQDTLLSILLNFVEFSFNQPTLSKSSSASVNLLLAHLDILFREICRACPTLSAKKYTSSSVRRFPRVGGSWAYGEASVDAVSFRVNEEIYILGYGLYGSREDNPYKGMLNNTKK